LPSVALRVGALAKPIGIDPSTTISYSPNRGGTRQAEMALKLESLVLSIITSKVDIETG
jgi:hypothetical protein